MTNDTEEIFIDGTYIEERFPNNRKLVTIYDLFLFHKCPQLFLKLHGGKQQYASLNKKEISYYKTIALEKGIKSKMIAELSNKKSINVNDWARRSMKIINRIYSDVTKSKEQQMSDINILLAVKKVYEQMFIVNSKILTPIVEIFATQELLETIFIREYIDILYMNTVKNLPEAFYIMSPNRIFSENSCIDLARMNAAMALSDINNIDEYIVSILFVKTTGEVKMKSIRIIDKEKEIEHYSTKLLSYVVEYRRGPLSSNWMACSNCIYDCSLSD